LIFLSCDKEKKLGILSVVRSDVEELVKEGFSNDYISKSVGIERNVIEYIIRYVREQQTKKSPRINNKDSNKGG
jgi:hypothetical protein